MAYRPITNTSSAPAASTTSLMAKKGLNLRDLPQLLSPENALIMRNYLLTTEGGLEKRKGLDLLFNESVTTGMLLLEEWTSDILVFAHGTTVGVYQISTSTSTDVKTDYVNSDFTGTRYGDYFFVASSGDKIERMSFTLDYDAQSANFTTGLVVTGGTSGATAIILEDSDAGATGTLTLGTISGTFANDEALTDSATGAAVVNGILQFTSTSVSNAPIAKHIKAIDTRLFAGNLQTEPSAVQYSETDTGSNPPFGTWSNAITATSGGKVYYRNAGNVNVIDSLGKTIVIFADKGKWAFNIDTIDSAGTLTKVDTTVMYLLDAGGNASIQTNDGIWYVNSQGLWLLQNLPQQNVKFTDQSVLVSNVLGNDFFNDVNFDQADMVKDDVTNTLLITFDEDSTENNKVLTFNTDLRAFGTITGWNINRFLNVGGTLYGGGSNTAKVWQILKDNDDDGTDIYTEFEQELGVGQLWTRKELLGQYIQGELSPTTSLDIKFSIFDRTGTFIQDKLELQWNYGTSDLTAKGYGESSWGDPWGGDVDFAATVENFAGYRGRIKNFQRIRVNISGNDQSPHTINWFSLQTREKVNIRRRNLTKI